MNYIQLGNNITNSNGGELGSSISLSNDGNTVAVGAPYSDSGYVAVYQYNSSNNSWIQLGGSSSNITNSSGANFGSSISLSSDGKTVAIGSPDSDNGNGMAAVYQYDSSNNSWIQLGGSSGNITNSSGGHFGYSISLSSNGNTVAVGAPFTSDHNGYAAVYQYNSSNNSWIQLGGSSGNITNSSGGNFGWSISLSNDGNTVAVGASEYNYFDGYVAVYQYNSSNNSWIQLGGTSGNITNSIGNGYFGTTISLSADGNTVAIGAPVANNYNGYAAVYQYNTSNNIWSQLGESNIINSSGGYLGYSISLSSDGNTVAVGAPFSNNNDGYVAVYQYYNSNNSWIQLGGSNGNITNSSGGNFGWAISFSGDANTLAVGAYRANDDNGYAAVYASSTICIHQDMLVYTNNGVKRIADIVSDDMVLDKYNNWIQVIYNIKSARTRDFYKFSKNCLGKNKPDSDFYIHGDHPVEYDNIEVLPKDLIGKIDGIASVTLDKDVYVYSLCTKDRTVFKIAGELLAYTWSLTDWNYFKIINGINYREV